MREMKKILFVGWILLASMAGCNKLTNLVEANDTETENSSGNRPPDFLQLTAPKNEAVDVILSPALKWLFAEDPDGDNVSYYVYLGTSGNPAMVGSQSVTSYTPGYALLPLTKYTWKIVAMDVWGQSCSSSTWTFTTRDSEDDGGGGGGDPLAPSITALSGLSQGDIRKGVLLSHPSQPSLLSYVYISTTSLNVYSRSSSDGGATWSAVVQVGGLSSCRDFAAGMDGSGTTVGVFIHFTNSDSGTGGHAVHANLPAGGAWTGLTTLYGNTPPGMTRLPSALPYSSGILFGCGYDTLGGGAGDDTHAISSYWNGGMTTAFNVGLSVQTDNPSYCQQIALDQSSGTMYYLYFDNHFNWESAGGDMIAITGTAPVTWAGGETRIVDAGSYDIPNQGFLFRDPGGDLVLLYGRGYPPNYGLFYRHAPALGGLEFASEVEITPDLAVPEDANSRYRTVYAVQSDAGDVHVVWETQSTHAIKWTKIKTGDYSLGSMETLSPGVGYIDGLSMSGNKVYVSLHDPSYAAAVRVMTNY